MTEQHRRPTRPSTPRPRTFAQQIADQVESFLLALRAIAREADGGRAISLLLLEISQVLLAGARLGAQQRLHARAREYQPDVGPDPDLDEMRLRLAELLDSVDTYSFVFDPYVARAGRRASSPTTSPASPPTSRTACATTAPADVDEALWWWQFSYVSSWGNLGERRAQRAAVGGRPRPARRRLRPCEEDAGRGRPRRCSTADQLRRT